MASKPLQPFTAVHTLQFEWARIGNLQWATRCADPLCDDGTGQPVYLDQTTDEYSHGEMVVVVPHATNRYAPWTVFCMKCASQWDNFHQLAFTRNYKFASPWAKQMTRLDPRFNHTGEIIETEIREPRACRQHGYTSFYSPAHDDHLCSQCENHSMVGRALYDYYAHQSVEVHKDTEVTRKRGVGDTPTSTPNKTEEDADSETTEQRAAHADKATAEKREEQPSASNVKQRAARTPRRTSKSGK
jgi:hypothetical protein